MTKYTDIITRLEGASGPDADLDREIWALVSAKPKANAKSVPYVIAPMVTLVLDAAVGLVERMLPGVYWNVGRASAVSYSADLSCHGNEYEAPTAPLALLLALFRALQAQEGEA